MKRKSYSTRSAAIRAARKACKRALAAPFFQAYEGHDYLIHPDPDPFAMGYRAGSRYCFELKGPAAEAIQATETAAGAR